MLKHKRSLLIVLAIMVLALLFAIKNGAFLKNKIINFTNDKDGLTYNTAIVEDLVTLDSDGDTIPDWEENLWQLDPTKKETTAGIPDSTAIAKLKIDQGEDASGSDAASSADLTETDKFSRELFSTVASLSQSGSLDQSTLDKITASLNSQLQNAPAKKTFVLSDLKISKESGASNIKKYNEELRKIFSKYQLSYGVIDVLDKFIKEENSTGSGSLSDLDPIIKQMDLKISAFSKISVPQSLAISHLDLLNKMEKVLETLRDMRLYDTDVIVALRGISQYGADAAALEESAKKLEEKIIQSLNN